MSTSGFPHKQQASSRPHFRAVRKVLWKMVKNCVRNRSIPEEIDTDIEICTSLKSEFYFRFRWPPSTMSTLISYTSVRVLVTIRGKMSTTMGILHTSKIGNVHDQNLHLSKIRILFPGLLTTEYRDNADEWYISSVQISVSVSILSGIERLRAQFFTIFHKTLRTARKCGRLCACCFWDKPEVDYWF